MEPRGQAGRTRNYFLKGDGALLHWAVLRFAMNHMVSKGYTPMVVPLLMRMRHARHGPISQAEDKRIRWNGTG